VYDYMTEDLVYETHKEVLARLFQYVSSASFRF